jgi:hypothetical protein
MKRAVIVHGMPTDKSYHDLTRDNESNGHWLPWLQQQLCARDILTQTPEMPIPYAPEYQAWKDEFERQVIDEDTILIGHSCGGGFLIRWLSEVDKIVGKIILVAPWLDIEKKYSPLFEFNLNASMADKTRKGIDLLYSTNDDKEMQTTLAFLQASDAEIRYHEFKDYGHFCLRDMKTREFPELLKLCLR